jgi:hypothetical protein
VKFVRSPTITRIAPPSRAAESRSAAKSFAPACFALRSVLTNVSAAADGTALSPIVPWSAAAVHGQHRATPISAPAITCAGRMRYEWFPMRLVL